jgi:hypothetical protein
LHIFNLLPARSLKNPVKAQATPNCRRQFETDTHEHTPCPRCGYFSYRHTWGDRTLHDLGDLSTGHPVDLLVTYSSHYCSRCRQHFNVDLSDVAPPGSHDTHRVIELAVRLVVEDNLPYRPTSWHLWRDHRVFVPFATIQNWVEAGGGKRRKGR